MNRPTLLYARLALIFALCFVGYTVTAQASTWCRQGEPPIQVSARTSCQFAGSALDRYYNNRPSGVRYLRARVYSSVSHKSYVLTYRRGGNRDSGNVKVTGPNGIWLRFNWSRIG